MKNLLVIFLLLIPALYVNSQDWYKYTPENSDLPEKSVQAIAEDENGNLWLGMEENFVFFNVLNETFDIYDVYNTGINNQYPWLTDFDISAIGIDGDGNVYFSLGGWIICNFNGSWNVIDDLYLTNAWSFACDQDGILWMATYDGLCKFVTETTVQCYNTSNSNIPTNIVKDIVIDENNKIWIACGGVTSFDGSSFTVENSCSASYLGYLGEKIAVSPELLVFDGSSWNTLEGNTVPLLPNYIEFEANGAVWLNVSTSNAYLWNGIDWETRHLGNTNNGIPLTITCIHRGENAWLWFGGLSDCLSVFKGSTPMVGIMDNNQSMIKIYPNPAKDYIQLCASNPEQSSYKIRLFNSIGTLVKYLPDYYLNDKINTSSLTTGIYYLSIEDDTKSNTYKFIIL